MATHSESVTFAVVGDVEPKPEPVFDNFRKVVQTINRLAGPLNIRFTASVGDLVHRGSIDQYRCITDIVETLTTPFYPIMGNEELEGGYTRYGQFVSRWTQKENVKTGRYVVTSGKYAVVFVTARRDGVTPDEEEVTWLLDTIHAYERKRIVLFTHAPAKDAFPDAGHRAMQTDAMRRVLSRPNVVMHFSGHTHFDLEAVAGYAVDDHGVHHIHAPGIERTKVGVKHTPRFRIVRLHGGGAVDVMTYNVKADQWEPRFNVRVNMK